MLPVLLVGVLACFIIYLIQDYLHFKKLPPGVYGLPFLGYLPFIGTNYLDDLARLSKKYGDIYSVRLGSENVVFLSNWNLVKDALSNPKILGKPKTQFGGFFNEPGIINSDGPLWKEYRKVSLRILHDLGVGGQVMEENIHTELSHFLSQINANVEKPYNIDHILFQSVLNNIAYLIFGHRFEYDDPVPLQIHEMQKNFIEQLRILAPVNFLPLLTKLLASVVFKDVAEYAGFIKNMITNELRLHKEKSDQDQINDFMDGCLAAVKNNKSALLTDEAINACASDYFGAGADTVMTTLKWLLLLTAADPKLQAKVQDEIDKVIGKERPPTWADRSQMHYTQAVISESQRWAPIVPLNLPRRVIDDTVVGGHFVAKDTRIIVNFWAVSRDATVWKDPETFRPERFLSKDGKEVKKFEALVPFSYGKRSCVGEGLAQREVFLYYVSTLQKYQICIQEKHEVTLEGIYNFSFVPKQPPIYVFKQRK